MSPLKSRELRIAFSDICNGYSVIDYNSDKLYIKHLSHHEQADLDLYYEKCLVFAEKQGLPSREERTEQLIEKEEAWTKEENVWLDNRKKQIDNLIESKRLAKLKSQIDNLNREIDDLNKEYFEKKRLFNSLLGVTKESYADKKLQERYILKSFYTNESFNEEYFGEEKMEYFSDNDITKIIIIYNSAMEKLDDDSLKLIAIQDFFQSAWGLANDNAYYFFGKFICNLTYYQTKLLHYARHFRAILQSGMSFTDEIKNDPDKLSDYYLANQNVKKQMEKHKREGAVSHVGAKTGDYEAMGLNASNSTRLTSELKKSGKKSLSMQDMMKLMGAE